MDNWAEKDEFPVNDLDDAAFVYESNRRAEIDAVAAGAQ